MKLKSIRSVVQLKGKTVLYRTAYDVPLKKSGTGMVVADDRRITESLPTLRYLLKKQCKIVVMPGWLGRPDGKVVESLKMDPVARALARLIKKPVTKLDDCVGPVVSRAISKMKNGQIVMLENTRFYPEEMADNKLFAALLVQGMDLICFDAFGHIHRVHASTTGITKLLPSYAGLLMEKEINELSKVTTKPKRPMVVVMGGAKISDKIHVLTTLVKHADRVLIGGGLANVFLKAQGVAVGKSYLEDVFVDSAQRKKVNTIDLARALLKQYKNKIIIPTDLVAGSKVDARAATAVVDVAAGQHIRSDWMFLDIGPKTVAQYVTEIKRAKTIFFNGPMGVFELKLFGMGTEKIARAIGQSPGTTIVGGGDTEIVADKYQLEKKFSHVSTGGGASMAFLAGATLPVLEKLIKK